LGRGEAGLPGGRGVSKCSSCSGLSGSIRLPNGSGSRGSGSICLLKGRGSGASSICSEKGGDGVSVRWVSNGREEVEMKGEDMVEGEEDIWIRLMVIRLGDMREPL
jgi:hypothetical protein